MHESNQQLGSDVREKMFKSTFDLETIGGEVHDRLLLPYPARLSPAGPPVLPRPSPSST